MSEEYVERIFGVENHRLRYFWFWVVFAAVSLIAVLAFSFFEMHGRITENVFERRLAIARLASSVIEERIEKVFDLSLSLATRKAFGVFVEEKKWSEAFAIVKDIPQDFSVIDSVTLVDPSGILRATTAEDQSVVGQGFADRDWYQGVSREWTPYISDIILRRLEPTEKVIVVATPIKNAKDVVTGILLLRINIEDVFAVHDVGEENGFIYVVNSRGRVVLHPQYVSPTEIPDFSSMPIVQKVLRGESATEVVRDAVGGGSNVVAYAPVKKYGFGVVFTQDVRDAFLSRTQALRIISLIYALLFGIFISAVFFLLRMVRILEEGREREKNFLSITSHQLRTPLGAMRWNMQMLMEGDFGRISVGIRNVLQDIFASNQRMIGLVDDLLNVSRIEQGRVSNVPSTFDVREVIEEALREMRLEAEERRVSFSVSTSHKGTIPQNVFVDRDRCYQVLLNVISNAVKYNKKGGSVHIEIQPRYRNKITVRVSDTGIGIPSSEQAYLFSKFFRASNAIRGASTGSGLGLFVVKSFVDEWGGTVDIKTEENKGTTVSISFPAVSM